MSSDYQALVENLKRHRYVGPPHEVTEGELVYLYTELRDMAEKYLAEVYPALKSTDQDEFETAVVDAGEILNSIVYLVATTEQYKLVIERNRDLFDATESSSDELES